MAENPFQIKKTGLAALLEAQEKAKREQAALATTSKQPERAGTYITPANARERIKIIFDDSGSMSGQKLADAHEGCEEFMRNCVINDVAVGIYPMNLAPITLETNLPVVAALVKQIQATGGTPMFETLYAAMSDEIPATRYIIFSDGQPNDTEDLELCVGRAITEKTPVDCVFIADGDGDRSRTRLMKDVAERTGGIFLYFERGKVNFATAFKYLAPNLRLKLSDGNFRKALEAGEVK